MGILHYLYHDPQPCNTQFYANNLHHRIRRYQREIIPEGCTVYFKRNISYGRIQWNKSTILFPFLDIHILRLLHYMNDWVTTVCLSACLFTDRESDRKMEMHDTSLPIGILSSPKQTISIIEHWIFLYYITIIKQVYFLSFSLSYFFDSLFNAISNIKCWMLHIKYEWIVPNLINIRPNFK